MGLSLEFKHRWRATYSPQELKVDIAEISQSSVVRLVDPEPLDDFGKMWLYLMRGIDNSSLSQAEKLGCIEFVKHEMLTRMMASQTDGASSDES